jgi:hypothetical protein
MKAPDHLEAGAKTFRERNLLYGDNYLNVGKVFQQLFPEGVEIKSEKDWDFIISLMNCQFKLMRAAVHFSINHEAHADSIHDLMVYAAMFAEVSEKDYKNGKA